MLAIAAPAFILPAIQLFDVMSRDPDLGSWEPAPWSCSHASAGSAVVERFSEKCGRRERM
jgi:hypothetical protein